MRIALVCAELTPFAKTGGLGDAVAGLTRFLGRSGHDARCFLPAYSVVDRQAHGLVPVDFVRDVALRFDGHTLSFSLLTCPLPPDGPAVYFIDCPALFERSGIYTGEEDDAGRFAFLARAALESCQRMGFAPEILHVHDWHAALAPLYLRTHYAWDGLFAHTKTLLTVHNIGYQGVFDAAIVEHLDLDGHREWLPQEDLTVGRFNFLRTGLWLADAISTVSPRHAREILTKEYGAGLDPVLRARAAAGEVFGILNGVDEEWNPETDPILPVRYSVRDLSGKRENKRLLLEELGLEFRQETPLAGVVTRLTKQKGIDLMIDVLPRLLEARDLQLVAVASGEARYETFLEMLQGRFPRQVVYYRGYSNELAHRVEAAADLFLMPSLYEPCGLNQMYSLRYGTVPVVRATGGLADSVEPYDWRSQEGTGFVFEDYSADGFLWAIDAALETFRHAAAWDALRRRAMTRDFSWHRQGSLYVEAYERLLRR